MENLNNLILNHSTINESPTFASLNLSTLNEVIFDKNIEQRRLASFKDLEVVEFWPWQIVLITCYTFAAVASFFLNIITILVLIKPERSITSELWKFLVLLCISDIGMSLFCIPTTYLQAIKQRWILPLWLCPVVNFAQFCFVFVSIWVLVVIGIDRYFAIVHPLYMMSWMRRYRLSIIAFICTLGVLFGSIQWFVSKAVYRNRNGIDIWYCEETWSRQYSRYFTIFIFVSTFALPLSLLFFVYATIFFRILSHAAPGNPDPNLKRDQQNYKRKLKVLSWLVVIVILFFVWFVDFDLSMSTVYIHFFSWFPINLINMLIEFKEGFLQPRSHSDAVLFYVFFFSAHFISMFHSLVNPVVYCFMSERFRKNMYRKMLVFWRIRNFFNIYSYTSENIELNIQGEPQTITSRTRKTNTKHKGSTFANCNNNHQNNLPNNHHYLENHNSQKQNAQNNENFHHNLSNKISLASDVLYGPTALSTEDSVLHEQLSDSVGNSLTISRRRRRHNKSEKYDKILRKYEAKLLDCKEKNNEGKADKIREKIDYMVQREKDRIAVNEDTKVNFDPSGKSVVFKVEDAPVRVLNKLAALGYTVLPSAGGGSSSGHGHGHHPSFVWTLYRPNYQPTPIYPKLQLSSTD